MGRTNIGDVELSSTTTTAAAIGTAEATATGAAKVSAAWATGETRFGLPILGESALGRDRRQHRGEIPRERRRVGPSGSGC